ncbi:MAG: amino acid transporter [Alphaproteobacteria bacterium]|nr:MAG: amino acid transporter [Alphaproteobacteria bacterium]
MPATLVAFAQGVGLGGGLIIAIGAQNAYVLRQGLRREFALSVASICFLCDVALIALGAGGFGSLVAAFPALTRIAAWGGAAFLAWYGFRALRSALAPGALEADGAARAPSRSRAVFTALALSLLNPHVYLDTVVLIGGIAGQYAAATRPWFAAGAMSASLLWFYGLALGARRLAPLFKKPAAWRILDLVICAVMWSIAASLLRTALAG